jgi:predicted GH43/DUF377 family glycosyl hydrolase
MIIRPANKANSYIHNPYAIGAYEGWLRYEKNPLFGQRLGNTYDACILELQDRYRMYFSWKNTRKIYYSESTDKGYTWSSPMFLFNQRNLHFEQDMNRPCVLIKDNKYHMWYSSNTIDTSNKNLVGIPHSVSMDNTEISKGTSCITHATSDDGVVWERQATPVLTAEYAWEKNTVTYPHVIWDEDTGLFRMWYSAGDNDVPDAIGYATSEDGEHWNKYQAEPVFEAQQENLWERLKVNGCQVIKENGWHYMFYTGYETKYRGRICIARSRDGVTNWERHPGNPIIVRGTIGEFDVGGVFKPYLIHEEGNWKMFFTGYRADQLGIGMLLHEGDDLGF